MVDITAKLFWYRTTDWYGNMADKLNDIVYTDDSKETVNVINLLLLGWVLLGLIVYIIGTVIATQLRKRKSTFSSSELEISSDGKSSESAEHVSCASELKSTPSEFFSETKEVDKTFIIPTCVGDEQEIVDWINSVFSWIYKNRVISPVLDAWISALNARTRLLSTEHGILVDFKEVTFTSGAPDVREATEICTTRGDLNVVCDLVVEDVNFDISVTQVNESDKTVTPFFLNVRRISGKVNVECVPEDLSFVAKYSEVPAVELSAEIAHNAVATVENPEALKAVVCEICSEAFSSSIVDFKFSCYPECPRLTLKSIDSEEDVFESTENEAEEKLIVKIIKASNIGGNEGCLQPYCIVEMDEPPQRFETRAVQEKSNPLWDESFTFTVKDVSAELLFEIYDKEKPSKENFLGLGIVSVDELIRNPSQRQIIPLQSRPLEDDNVTGSLTTEFLFLNPITPVNEPNHISQKTVADDDGKTVETNSRVTAGGTVITTTTIKRTKEDHYDRPKANAIPFAAPVIKPVHEHSEEWMHNESERMDASAGVDFKNRNCLNPDPSYPKSNAEVKQNGFIANGEQDSVGNSLVASEALLSVDPACLLLNACEEVNLNKEEDFTKVGQNKRCFAGEPEGTLHVPDTEAKQSFVGSKDAMHVPLEQEVHFDSEHSETENSFNCTENKPINHPIKLHDIIEPLLLINDMSESSSTLPTIVETVESSSTSSKGLEKDKDVEADLTGTALKELEKHSKPINATSKSTLIIHSVQRGDSSVSESLEASPASHLSKDSRTSCSESVPSSPSQDRSGDDRSRSKEKKSLLGSIRRRLSFRKNRSKSAENRSESSNYSQGSSRSASSDRLRSKGQKPSPLKGKFMGMKFLAVPGSTRSSLSEASGISGSSSRTYINENSTLVIETNENGIIKRYLIPNSLVHRSKWKKRGTKLHIYNDHVFVAKHLSGSTICKVCQKYLTRRPGKQGYECRGCNLQCHKSCHVKVENYCSNSSINSMEVEYIHDPKGASPKSV